MPAEKLSIRLKALLEMEREALLSGNLDQLEPILQSKLQLAEEIAINEQNREALIPVREALRRNQELFDQALSGIRNVANRLSDLQKTERSTATYDSTGRRQNIETVEKKKLEKKA